MRSGRFSWVLLLLVLFWLAFGTLGLEAQPPNYERELNELRGILTGLIKRTMQLSANLNSRTRQLTEAESRLNGLEQQLMESSTALKETKKLYTQSRQDYTQLYQSWTTYKQSSLATIEQLEMENNLLAGVGWTLGIGLGVVVVLSIIR